MKAEIESAVFLFPGKRQVLLLLSLILLQFVMHLGTNSPYVYYTKGNYNLVDGYYGLRIGPSRMILHADAINYWSTEGFFQGRSGDRIRTAERPLYPFIASILSYYIHSAIAGWIINTLFWLLAAVFGYAFIRQYCSPRQALLFSVLIATSPAYVNMCGQPMGYILSYSLFMIFISISTNLKFYSSNRTGYLVATIFLAVLCAWSYEMMGFVCLLFLTAFQFGRLPKKDLLICISSTFFISEAWLFLFAGKMRNLSPSSIGIGSNFSHLIPDSLSNMEFWAGIKAIIVKVLSSYLYSTFFLPSMVAPVLFLKMHKETRILVMMLLMAPLAAILLMGYVAEIASNKSLYMFYPAGRIAAFIQPAIYATIAFGIGERCTSKKVVLISIIAFVITNADIAGFRLFFHIFNMRPL